MGLFGPPNVDKLTARRDVSGLVKALQYRKDVSVRKSAAATLAKIGGALAVHPLIAALRDDDLGVRCTAIAALVQIGTSNGDRDLRGMAIAAVVEMGTAAIDPLLNALKHHSYTAREVAGNALVKIGTPAVEPLIAALEQDGMEIKHGAIATLGKLGDRRAVEPLIAMLGDKSVQQQVIESLGEIHDISATPALLSALNDKDKSIRRKAAEALEKIGWRPGQDEDSARYWIALLKHDECAAIGVPAIEPLKAAATQRELRRFAIFGLLKIGGSAIRPLIEVLRKSSEYERDNYSHLPFRASDLEIVLAALKEDEWDVRIIAAGILEQSNWRPEQDELVAWFWLAVYRNHRDAPLWEISEEDQKLHPHEHFRDEPDPRSIFDVRRDNYSKRRNEAVEALGSIGQAAVEFLVPALKSPDEGIRCAAAAGLGRIGAKRAVEPLIKALQDDKSDVRCEAVRALGELGGSAVEPLIAALDNADHTVRYAAAQALRKSGDPRAVDPLIAALKDSNCNMRRTAAKALGEIGDARAVEPLIATLKDLALDDVAAQALGKLGTPAVQPLIALLKDSDHEIRQRAAKALDLLGWQPGQEETGAAYWIAREKLDKCLEFGSLAVEPLINVLKHREWWVHRRDACLALANICTGIQDGALRERIVDSLIEMLDDHDEGVRIEAARGLGHIRDARAVDPLMDLWKTSDHERTARVHEAAFEALVQIGKWLTTDILGEIERKAGRPQDGKRCR